MKIKRMDCDDLKKHFNDFVTLFAENTRGHTQNQKIEDDYIILKAKELIEYLSQDKAVLLGVFSCQQLTGFLWSYPRIFLEMERMYINSLIISGSHRGKGYGTLLIKELEKYAIEKNIYSIDVTTASFKTDAIGFYEKTGFELERVQLMKILK